MKNEKLVIILTDDDIEEHVLFKEIVAEFKEIDSFVSFEKGTLLLDYLSKDSSNAPSILFLDLNMPSLTGLECLKEIRANPSNKNLSVAIYSTSSSDKDIEQAFVNGANLYITKPNNFQEMKKMLQRVLKINWKEHSLGLKRKDFKLSI